MTYALEKTQYFLKSANFYFKNGCRLTSLTYTRATTIPLHNRSSLKQIKFRSFENYGGHGKNDLTSSF